MILIGENYIVYALMILVVAVASSYVFAHAPHISEWLLVLIVSDHTSRCVSMKLKFKFWLIKYTHEAFPIHPVTSLFTFTLII